MFRPARGRRLPPAQTVPGWGKIPVEPDTPAVVEAEGVTHLRYQVRRFAGPDTGRLE